MPWREMEFNKNESYTSICALKICKWIFFLLKIWILISFPSRIVPKLFFSCDHPQHDPIITEARLHTEKMLCPMVSDFVLDPPPLVLGLTKPYSISNGSVSSHIESNLSRVVVSALHQLNMSQSKHLTVRVNFAD